MGYRDRNVGHIYVMHNPAMPGLVKIGRTRSQTKGRARELYSTGVPREFIVLWEEIVHDCDKAEKEMHDRFKESRINSKREFFAVEPQQAIRALMEVARRCLFDLNPKSPRVSIIDGLRTKFGHDLRPDIIKVNVASAELGAFFLEIVRIPSDLKKKKKLVDYVDLDVLGEEFTFGKSLNVVATDVLGLDPLSIAMVTNLLTDEAGLRIWEESQKDVPT